MSNVGGLPSSSASSWVPLLDGFSVLERDRNMVLRKPTKEISSGHVEALGKLDDRRDTEIAQAPLGPRVLDWMNTAAMSGGFLRDAQLRTPSFDVRTNALLWLHAERCSAF